jgi:hypothetical protein
MIPEICYHVIVVEQRVVAVEERNNVRQSSHITLSR